MMAKTLICDECKKEWLDLAPGTVECILWKFVQMKTEYIFCSRKCLIRFVEKA